ncbi:hypothetical protein CORC01_01558 [Colletotrichum orchidophilum]|uniref:Uncharacterized protein n=1 Tax=Colletotrichum orchidophilum TaxID=1209926 RepID=A0A1G4BP23_9PEZI|nr:uncharacterized protein CORC01_01558 [Colletotrichum orchidophilum]OHF03174.1 hypothetical protein CORC01_01558 [Colletotrichum orchidophilum]
MVSEIHVISKHDLSKHETVAIDLPLPQLGLSSIRVRTSLIGITSNNLSYAKLGDRLQWWNTWPVPLDAPAPYSDRTDWGIVPAWGFARVVESNIEAIPARSLLFGYWPTSSHPVDLSLVPSEPKGHFCEVSEHRQGLGSIYNRYNLVEESAQPEEYRAWFANVSPIWNAGYVMNRFTFATDFKPVHPLGEGAGEWTGKDADLSSAVVVNLSASSRTGRSFSWNLARDRTSGSGPLALLQATSAPESLTPGPNAAFEVKTVNYDSLTSNDTIDWIVRLKPKRVVVADFGGPPKVMEEFHEAIRSILPESTVFTNILVGGEPKLQTPEQALKSAAMWKKWGLIQLNTTGVVDAGIAIEGAGKYFEGAESTFRRSLEEGIVEDLELIWGSGVGGTNGIEKAWEEIVQGTLSPRRAWVYRLE